MKRNLLVVGSLIVGMAASNLNAQSPAKPINPQCEPGETQDICQKAIDLFRYVGAQLGTVIAGGNATLGQGGTLGGFPHFRAGLRINVMRASIPRIDEQMVSTAGAQESTYGTDGQFIPLPQIDAALGVFKGIPLGITNVGGVDLLLSLSYLPTIEEDEFTLSGSTKIGVGFRLGLVQETALVPGVSLTYLRRDLPAKASFNAAIDDDSVSVQDVSVKTSAWRLVASKNLLIFGLAAGYGKDTYTSDATFMGHISGTPPVTLDPTSARKKVSRNNLFLDVTMNLPFVKLIGEIGQVSGGDNYTFNNFDKGPNASRMYGSVGFRAGF